MEFSSFACWCVFCAVCVCVCVRVCAASASGNGVQKKEPLSKTQRLFCLWLLVVPCKQAYKGFGQAVKKRFKQLPG